MTGTFAYFGLSARNSQPSGPVLASLLMCGATVTIGLLTGLIVDLSRGGEQRFAWAVGLGMLGVLGGSVGGGLSVPAVILFRDTLHPIPSSALAWALAGLVVGPIGHAWSRWLHPPEPPPDDEGDTPSRRVAWLLRQDERRFRDRPLFRVLPVLSASALALVGAAVLAPSLHALSLTAVGALGLAVTLVLSAQERRQRELDARLRALEQLRNVPEDETLAP